MPNTVKQTLANIRQAQLTALQDSSAQDEQQQVVNECHLRLMDLVGPIATELVEDTLESVATLYYARELVCRYAESSLRPSVFQEDKEVAHSSIDFRTGLLSARPLLIGLSV